MKFTYDGRQYEWDITLLSVEECEAIEKYTGTRGMGDWSNQMAVLNTKSMQALWWAIRRQDGQNPGAIAVRDPAFRPLALNDAMVKAEEAEAAAAKAREEAEAGAAEADPTLPALSSPASGATTTTPAPAAATLSLPG